MSKSSHGKAWKAVDETIGKTRKESISSHGSASSKPVPIRVDANRPVATTRRPRKVVRLVSARLAQKLAVSTQRTTRPSASRTGRIIVIAMTLRKEP